MQAATQGQRLQGPGNTNSGAPTRIAGQVILVCTRNVLSAPGGRASSKRCPVVPHDTHPGSWGIPHCALLLHSLLQLCLQQDARTNRKLVANKLKQMRTWVVAGLREGVMLNACVVAPHAAIFAPVRLDNCSGFTWPCGSRRCREPCRVRPTAQKLTACPDSTTRTV